MLKEIILLNLLLPIDLISMKFTAIFGRMLKKIKNLELRPFRILDLLILYKKTMMI